VAVANGDILPAKEAGNVSFKIEQGYITFTAVLHVPGLDRNLISVPPLTSKGLAKRMSKDKYVISGKQRHVMTVKKSGSLYSINCYTTKVAVTETPKSESPRIPVASAIRIPGFQIHCFYVNKISMESKLSESFNTGMS
jgi:hypothetical protein